MMSSKKQASKIVMGVLVIVLIAMAAFIVLKNKNSDSAAGSTVNYDDPNMAKTNEFVNEATASCLQKEADAGSDIPSCINNYKGEPAKNGSPSKSEAEPGAHSSSAPDSSDLDGPATSVAPPRPQSTHE